MRGDQPPDDPAAMCFDHDSHPPIEPISGAALDAGRISLTSEAGDHARFLAYLARPAQPTGAGIVILPDVRGLHPFFEELALRFAERGITALAIDYFARTAATDDAGRGLRVSCRTSTRRAGRTSRATSGRRVTHLRALDPAPRSMFTTGFCMGGRLSSMSATLGLGLAGVIPFYGWPIGPNRNGTPAPAESAGAIECDVLAIYGGADQGIPGASPATVRRRRSTRPRSSTRRWSTPDAPHGFFDRKAAGLRGRVRRRLGQGAGIHPPAHDGPALRGSDACVRRAPCLR